MQAGERRKTTNPLFNLRMISSLESPPFRLYFFGTLGQMAAMVVGQVTGPLLMYRLSGSAVLLGTMSLLSAVPLIFLSLFGGVIADRIPKKQIILVSYLCFAAVSLGVGLALHTGWLARERDGSYWILLSASFVQGGIMGLLMPSLQAMVPEIVKKEYLMNASALSMMGMNILTFVIPIITGVVIDRYNFQTIYYGMAGLYLYAAVFILFAPRVRGVPKRGVNVLVEIGNGFQYIRRSPVLWAVLAYSTVVVALSMPFQQLLPIFTTNILKVDATGLGLLMSVSGLADFIGSVVLTALPNRKRGLMLVASGLLSGLALSGFAFSTQIGLSLGLMVLVGLGVTFRGTISSALLQSYSTPIYMGRVMSLFNIQWGLMALGTFGAGLMVKMVGVQWVVGGMALVLSAISLLTLSVTAALKKLE